MRKSLNWMIAIMLSLVVIVLILGALVAIVVIQNVNSNRCPIGYRVASEPHSSHDGSRCEMIMDEKPMIYLYAAKDGQRVDIRWAIQIGYQLRIPSMIQRQVGLSLRTRTDH